MDYKTIYMGYKSFESLFLVHVYLTHGGDPP